MKTFNRLLPALMAVAMAVMLSGCLPAATPVKYMLSNPEGYLQMQMAPNMLGKSVTSAIDSRDAGPLHFKSMHLVYTTRFVSSDGSKKLDTTLDTTYENAGGSYASMLTRYARNGVPFNDDFMLTYRGLVVVREREAYLNKSNSEWGVEAKSIQAFTPVTDDADKLNFVVASGWTGEISSFMTVRTSCSVGKPHPASQVDKALAGTARDMTCDLYNSNGIKKGTTVYAYLDQYGLAVKRKYLDASGIVTFHIDSITIQ